MGQILQINTIFPGKTEVNLNHLKNGVYFISIISVEGIIKQKIIKN
jgi:hypothetical protein